MLINGKQIKCLTFDLDDTLWECLPVILGAENTFFHWLTENCPSIASDFTPESLITHRREVFSGFPEMAHDFSWMRKRWFEGLLDQYGESRKHAETGFEVFLQARNSVTLFDGVTALLTSAAKHYRCGSITNGNADIKRVGIDHFFDYEITAGKSGAAKPSPIIFQHSIDASGVSPDEILHIGDDPERDVRGAATMGMHTAWVNRKNQNWEGEHPPSIILNKVTDLGEILASAPLRSTF